MTTQHQFLVELGTEELPPTALLTLSEAFCAGLMDALAAVDVIPESIEPFATPRRLAARINGLPEATPAKALSVWGPPAAIAFDQDGQPTKAALAFAKKNGVDVEALVSANDGKVDKLLFETTSGGEALQDLLPGMVAMALANLPIQKRMRWGASREEFVRPVHWLVMLWNDAVVPGEVLGLASGNTTRGHRFHANQAYTLAHANAYETTLADAHVMANFMARRDTIATQVQTEGQSHGGEAVIDDDLLDEVTALVEWPVAITGRFDERFLQVPAEALISSMKEHQKYFHVVDAEQKLLPLFITVANIDSQDMAQVIAGNEKVIRPRLSDAAFFFEQDKKVPLTSAREKLKTMVFQSKLGTLFDKTERVAALAATLAKGMGESCEDAMRAGLLSKADLVTSMVYEFAEMQGIAGFYYAQNDGESEAVAKALAEQYLPKFAKDELPSTATGTALALADRLDTLAGIFGLGQVPTGSKDPFALRRASVAVLRLLIENQLDFDLKTLLQQAASQYPALPKTEGTELALTYMLERLRAWYEDAGLDTAIYQAVTAKQLTKPLEFDQRMHAVAAFAKLPEAESLASANKRVSNILAKQSGGVGSAINPALLQEPAEKVLAEKVAALTQAVTPMLAQNAYSEVLTTLASLREAVDDFFTDVMVMVDDKPLRDNRLALLNQLRNLFLEVADISYLVPAK